MYRVVSTSNDFGVVDVDPVNLLREHDCEFQSMPVGKASEEKMIELVKDVDVIVVGLQPVTERVVDAATRLKVIARHGAGVDNVDLKATGERGIPVVNAPGANAHSVADLAIGLMLALARKICLADRNTKNSDWRNTIGNEIYGKTLGICGLGEIGFKVAERARGFNMNLLAYDVVSNEALAREMGIVYTTKKDILQEADVITLHLPLMKETMGFISEEELLAMKSTAMLINTARGGIVDEKALFRALTEGWIAGAALDVFEQEPSVDHPLFQFDTFIATPHMGGITSEALTRTGMAVARDIVAVLQGKTPVHFANKEYMRR
jgi:D-3-phosphoglycerate dehydrogenase